MSATDVAGTARSSVRHLFWQDRAAWKTIPSWYLLATQDKAIPPATQRFMAQRAGATIIEVRASHVPMISKPDAITRLILDAANAIS